MPQNELLLFILFNLFILGLLGLDLGVFHRRPHGVSLREAAIWSVVWISLSLAFNVWLLFYAGPTTALEFLTGYLIEKALSVDNIFVFIVIFSYFGVPPRYQHKVLFWGVLGALVFRAAFIVLGVALINRFEWVLYVFGLILIISGWKLLTQKGVEVHPERNIVIRLVKRVLPVITDYDSPSFLVRRGGKLFLTPLFLVLITVETTDIVFAVDSIPAVFGVTRDPFIVYSSNVFAILGLRALYFLLSGAMTTLRYLNYGLSLILILIGVKMTLSEFVHVPIAFSLAAVATILAVTITASLLQNLKEKRKNPRESPLPSDVPQKGTRPPPKNGTGL